MGKPTREASSSKSHNRSRSNSSEHKMGSVKHVNSNKRKKAKLNKKIKKLFNNLRRQSVASLDTPNNTVIFVEDTAPTLKRKQSPYNSPYNSKKRKLSIKNSTVIEINDDAETPIHCSTPLQNKPIHCSTPLQNKPIHCSTPLQNKSRAELNFDKDISVITRHINLDDYHTIDLTSADATAPTVIDLNNVSESQDCVIVSASNASLSGDSDVTVLNTAKTKTQSEVRRIRRFANGIANLDPSSKGKVLELLTKTLGCELRQNHNQAKESRCTETVEDSYIKEVILGQRPSRNSIGSNIYNPERDIKQTGLRMIVIDGSNVAMEHGRRRMFSVKGLKICIDYFVRRGHTVKAFVPRFRCKFGKSSDPRLLDSLERQGLVVYTPSREVAGKMITSYDDRYIIQCAAEMGGVVVSGDQYRDLVKENPRWRKVIEERLLPFTWVGDMLMFPRDPLGRNGPTLAEMLRHSNSNTTNLPTVEETGTR